MFNYSLYIVRRKSKLYYNVTKIEMNEKYIIKENNEIHE